MSPIWVVLTLEVFTSRPVVLLSVSYTHLDVYKRQDHSGIELQGTAVAGLRGRAAGLFGRRDGPLAMLLVKHLFAIERQLKTGDAFEDLFSFPRLEIELMQRQGTAIAVSG